MLKLIAACAFAALVSTAAHAADYMTCSLPGNGQQTISFDYRVLEDQPDAKARVIFGNGLLASNNFYAYATPVGTELWYQDYLANNEWKRAGKTITVLQTQTFPPTTYVQVKSSNGAVVTYSSCHAD